MCNPFFGLTSIFYILLVFLSWNKDYGAKDVVWAVRQSLEKNKYVLPPKPLLNGFTEELQIHWWVTQQLTSQTNLTTLSHTSFSSPVFFKTSVSVSCISQFFINTYIVSWCWISTIAYCKCNRHLHPVIFYAIYLFCCCVWMNCSKTDREVLKLPKI